MRYPVDLVRITNGFRVSHQGADFAPPKPGQTGVAIYAPETGVVVASAFQLPVEGNYIILRGLETGKFYYFGHFAERKVQVGRGVAEGEVIGIMGKTGLATNIHCHVEVRDKRNTTFSGKVDPEQWFSENVKEGIKMDDKDVTSAYLAAGKSEAEATKPENLNYWRGKKPEELNKALYKGQIQDKYYYKASHYDEDVKAAYEKGKSEGGGQKFKKVEVYIPEEE